MSERHRERMMAKFEAATPEQQGRIALTLAGYATAYTLTSGGLATAVALSAVRIWRRRDRGLARAIRDGGHWRAVAGFAVASIGLEVARRVAIARHLGGVT